MREDPPGIPKARTLPIGRLARVRGHGGSRKARLLFGAVDIGWRIELYSKWIRQHLGDRLEVESFVKYKVSREQYPTAYTYEVQYGDHPSLIQWAHALSFFVVALFRFDIFHFFSGETLLTRKLRRVELRIYRLFGKRVIMHFVGSDIRNYEYLVWREEHLRGVTEDPAPPLSQPWQLRLVKDAVDYADHILVSTPDLLEIVPSAEFLPVCLDLEKFDADCMNLAFDTPLPETSGDVTILHAPSNVILKGTALLRPVVEGLEAEDRGVAVVLTPDLKVETGSVYSVPRLMLFALYDQADIVVDQLIVGWYGLQSVEALMRGCAVVCGIDESLRRHLPNDCPILVTDAVDLPEVLRRAVEDVRAGLVDTELQISWVRKYHTMERLGPILSERWLGSASDAAR